MSKSFTGLIMAAQVRDGTGDGSKWSAIFEIFLVTFFITLIPFMIGMDPQNLHWYDFWMPVWSALGTAAYAYVRARNIDVENNTDE